MCWKYRLLSEREWSGRNAIPLSADINGIYIPLTNLDTAFDNNGRHINPLIARLTGGITELIQIFHRCEWQAVPAREAPRSQQHILKACIDKEESTT